MKRFAVLLAWFVCAAVLAAAQRLPGGVVPDHYDLTLTPELRNATFSGEERILVRVVQPTFTITLHAVEIEFLGVMIGQNRKLQKAQVELDPKTETAKLTVARPLQAGAAQIHIRYNGILNSQLRGFYLSKGKGRNYAGSQLEATDARRAFPSFDEPALKATFAITLIVDQGDTAISNGRIVSDTPGPGAGKHTLISNGGIVSDTPGPGAGKHTLKFSRTPKMSAYLVALAVGDFQCQEGAADGVPIRICSTPDKVHLGKFALRAAEQQVAWYNRYFGIPYPFEKLDVLALPDFEAGAMENAGAIFYRESVLLLDEERASLNLKKTVAEVLSHEIAHMWFGDLVTMKWWDDIWLNEGFADWIENEPLKEWKPEWDRRMTQLSYTTNALNLDSLATTRQIRKQAQASAEINELFDGIAYGKSASVLRMVEGYVGREPFRRGVQAYLKKYSWSNASAEDFWNTLTKVSGKPVDRIMASYVDQPGAPMVTVRAACAGGQTTVTLEQQRFFYDRDKLDAGSPELWTIPVCLKTPEGAPRCELITRRKQQVTLPGCAAWVNANAGGAGHYRTAYDVDTLHRMAADLGRLTPGERMRLLNDEWGQFRTARHGVGEYLALAEGLRAERTRAIVLELTIRLDFIGDNVIEDHGRAQYRTWVGNLLRPAAQELGWAPAPGEAPELGSVRAYVLNTLGYTGRDPEVLAQARARVQQSFQDPAALDPTLAATAVNLAALEGDAALFDEFQQRMESATTPEQRALYRNALAKFRDPALIRRALEYAISGRMRNQDAPLFIANILDEPESRDTAWEFVKAHWAPVQATFTPSSGAAVVEAAGSFCDARGREEVRDFFTRNPVSSADATLAKSLEQISTCTALRQRQRTYLADWLAGQSAPGGH